MDRLEAKEIFYPTRREGRSSAPTSGVSSVMSLLVTKSFRAWDEDVTPSSTSNDNDKVIVLMDSGLENSTLGISVRYIST